MANSSGKYINRYSIFWLKFDDIDLIILQRSKSGKDIVDGDPYLQVSVLTEGNYMLFDCISNTAFLPSLSNIPLDLYAHLSDVRHRLIWSCDYQVEGFLQVHFSMDWQAYLSKRVDGGDFEMETGIFSNDFTEPRNEGIDPVWPKYPN